jgi:hypothetical protein
MPNEPSDPHVVSDPEGRAISQANNARRSGNFLFEYDDERAISEAIKIGKQATGLECVVRRFPDLLVASAAVPTNATIEKGSVVFRNLRVPNWCSIALLVWKEASR